MEFLALHKFRHDEAELDATGGLLAEPGGIDRQVLGLHAAGFEIALGVFGQLLGFLLDQGLRHFDRVGLDQHVHHALLDAGLDAALDFTLQVGLDLFAHLGHVAVGNAQGLGELGVHLGQLGLFNLLDGHFELDGLAGQVLGVVLGREGHVEGLALAGLEAQHSGLEVLEHLAATDHEGEVGRLAAVELDAVLAAGEVHHHAVAVLGGTLDLGEGGALLAQHVEGLVDLGVTDFQLRTLDLVGAHVGDDDLGVNLEDRGELEGVGAGGLLRLDAGVAGDAQVLGADLLAEHTLDRGADGLGAGLGAVRLGDHAERDLARTEARHLDGAGHLLQTRFDILFDIGQRHGHVDTALESAHHGFLVAHENFLIGFDENDAGHRRRTRGKTHVLRMLRHLWASEKFLV